jgi:hypothetical protein
MPLKNALGSGFFECHCKAPPSTSSSFFFFVLPNNDGVPEQNLK